jgi:L-ascorbate metabolism protein UlaG (beta-lactamase superfamily)
MATTLHLVLPESPAPAAQGQGSVFFVGTATVILRYAGFTLLTDPNFLHAGDHVHLGYGVRSQRLTEPAIDLGELPPIDLVLLSHLHEDHFDRRVARELDRSLPIVTTESAAVGLRQMGFRSAVGLSRWDTLEVEKGEARLRVTAMPARHGPPVASRFLPPVMGSMLEFEPRPLRVYISGDTLVYDDLREIPRRYPDVDLGLLHLGGTRILGVLLTMDGAQGVRAMQLVAPRRVIPIHYDDYTVFRSPLSEFQQAVRAAGLSDRVVYLARGETFAFDVTDLRKEGLAQEPHLVSHGPR